VIDTSEDVPARLATRDDRILCGKSSSCTGVVGRYSGGVLHLPPGMTEMLTAAGHSTTPRSFRLGKNAEHGRSQGRSGVRTRSIKRLAGDQDYVVPSYLKGTDGGSDRIRVKCPSCGDWNAIDQGALYTAALERIH
jgi:hypothetical protein